MEKFLNMNIEALRFLAQFRTPILDAIFSNITILAEEYSAYAVVMAFYWCINKKKANYLLIILFVGLVVNNWLKIIFTINRPWIIDPSFEIVEAAREGATGYSFPSGHTQVSAIIYGGIAYLYDNKKIKIAGYSLALLIAFSRMYLGVHTPFDVVVSLGLTAIFLPAFKNMYNHESQKKNVIYWVVCCFVALAFVFFASAKYDNALLLNLEAEEFDNYIFAKEISFKLLGVSLAAALSVALPLKYTNFKTEAPLLKQVIKYIAGFVVILAVQKLSKEPLILLFDDFGNTVRYFILVMLFTTIWPMTFDKLFNK